MRSHGYLEVVAMAVLVSGCGGGVAVPPSQPDAAAPESDARAFLEAMKWSSLDKPVVAVLARNEATETTDFLVTHAVLKRPGHGLHVLYDAASWVWLHALSPESLTVGDLDGAGRGDLIVDFGEGFGLGLFVFRDNTHWTRLHDLSPETVTAGSSPSRCH